MLPLLLDLRVECVTDTDRAFCLLATQAGPVRDKEIPFWNYQTPVQLVANRREHRCGNCCSRVAGLEEVRMESISRKP